jgi:hypothetical protein
LGYVECAVTDQAGKPVARASSTCMRDWQAVVLGGGVVSGLSLPGAQPAPSLDGLLKDDAGSRATTAPGPRKSVSGSDPAEGRLAADTASGAEPRGG